LGWENIETILPRAEHAALAAVRIDGEDPWAHYALASTYLMRRHFDDALAEYELALRLNPNFLHAQNHYAAALAFCGRWEEAGDVVRHALRSSPRDPFSALYYATASYAQYVGRNYEEAMRLAGAAIRMRRDFASAHRVYVAAAAMAGRADVACTALRELRRAQPNISLAWVAAAVPLRHDADRDRYLEGFRRAGLE
jgi:tetratricopeptide (TPR) repeat protein